jgi:hypothetical protein
MSRPREAGSRFELVTPQLAEGTRLGLLTLQVRYTVVGLSPNRAASSRPVAPLRTLAQAQSPDRPKGGAASASATRRPPAPPLLLCKSHHQRPGGRLSIGKGTPFRGSSRGAARPPNAMSRNTPSQVSRDIVPRPSTSSIPAWQFAIRRCRSGFGCRPVVRRC